jgi:hypothetical protein
MEKKSVSKSLKARWKKSLSKLSLKQFARKLLKDDDVMVKQWFAHKSTTWHQEAKDLRLKNKGGRIALEKNATKMARRKIKGGGGGSSK